MVKYDTTGGVINSGNAEVIGIRDRDGRRLYVSPVVTAGGKGSEEYLKIHTGLYIYLLRDAHRRAGKNRASNVSHHLDRYIRYYGQYPSKLKSMTPAAINLREKERQRSKEGRVSTHARFLFEATYAGLPLNRKTS